MSFQSAGRLASCAASSGSFCLSRLRSPSRPAVGPQDFLNSPRTWSIKHEILKEEFPRWKLFEKGCEIRDKSVIPDLVKDLEHV